MPEISLFVDEPGESGTESKYYLLTLVFHEQNSSIDKQIELYGNALHDKGLPDIPETLLNRSIRITSCTSKREPYLLEKQAARMEMETIFRSKSS